MTNKDRSYLIGILGLIFMAFSPVDEQVGKIVAIGGLAICSGIALYYFRKPEPPAKWPGDR